MTPDNELLARYAKTGSEEAFAELVRRYVDLVYSAALRQVGGDSYLAQDVAQTVFTDLARKARSLSCRQTLSGWVYTSAHFAAAKIARTEHRRRDREEKFMREPIHENTPEADWERLRPVLDAAMHELKETDREAILLRFFENQPFAQVGAKLNLNENAARMRVERAVEKLRALFAKCGIAMSGTVVAAISANAIQAAPGNLAASLTTASLASSGTGTFMFLKIMTATKLKLGISAAVLAGVTTMFVVQQQAQKRLSGENALLRQQISQLQTDNGDLSNHLVAASNAKAQSQPELSELLKLRGEVGSLKSELARTTKLAPAATNSSPTADTVNITNQYQKAAMFKLRGAKDLAAAVTLGFAEHYNDQFPTNWDQAAGYFDQWERNGLNPGEPMPDTATDFSNLTNEFDLVYQGSWHALTNAGWGNVIVVREKQPFQTVDGNWVKAYGFADGHSEIHSSPDGNFDAWEIQHIAQLPVDQ